MDMEYMENKELHELEARKSALNDALNSSLPQTVEHMESVLSALLAAQNQTTLQRFDAELKAIETLQPEVASMVTLKGEATADGSRMAQSERQAWRNERAQLEAKIAELQSQVKAMPADIGVPDLSVDKLAGGDK